MLFVAGPRKNPPELNHMLVGEKTSQAAEARFLVTSFMGKKHVVVLH
jgi:hypothetical protein